MRHSLPKMLTVVGLLCVSSFRAAAADSEPNSWYYHDGALAGSLKSDKPLPLYDNDVDHLWNRLFAAFYIRKSHLPEKPGGRPVTRVEGGDVIDFYGWGRTTYWSSAETADRLQALLDEFYRGQAAKQIGQPLKRAILLRDLWAAFDFLSGQNIRRFGSLETRKRRDLLCRKLSRVIESLALSQAEIDKLPDTYAAAVRSGGFAARHDFDPDRNYLPAGLLSKPTEWVEIDFFQPNLRGKRAARWKTRHETYRRLLDHLGR